MKRALDDLAIFGGAPAFAELLHVGRPNIGDRARLLERINDLLDRRWDIGSRRRYRSGNVRRYLNQRSQRGRREERVAEPWRSRRAGGRARRSPRLAGDAIRLGDAPAFGAALVGGAAVTEHAFEVADHEVGLKGRA